MIEINLADKKNVIRACGLAPLMPLCTIRFRWRERERERECATGGISGINIVSRISGSRQIQFSEFSPRFPSRTVISISFQRFSLYFLHFGSIKCESNRAFRVQTALLLAAIVDVKQTDGWCRLSWAFGFSSRTSLNGFWLFASREGERRIEDLIGCHDCGTRERTAQEKAIELICLLNRYTCMRKTVMPLCIAAFFYSNLIYIYPIPLARDLFRSKLARANHPNAIYESFIHDRVKMSKRCL